MKQIIYLFLLLLCPVLGAQAQPYRYSIAISDTAAIPIFMAGAPGSTTGTLAFGVSSLDSFASTSPVYSFNPAYPGANSAFLRDIYILVTDDTTLPYLLHQWDSLTFYYVREHLGGEPGKIPNDYYNTPDECDTPFHLDYIGAPLAWDYTEGDPSIIIGIVDEPCDSTHPDMTDPLGNKFQKMIGGNAPGVNTHGVWVASVIAGGTDNNTLLPAIGWKCRLASSMDMNDMTGIFQLSRDSLHVINASFRIPGAPSNRPPGFPTDYRLEDESVANEVYEFGTSLVACAGNGRKQEYTTMPNTGDTMKWFPASYENVISVSGVGHVTEPGNLYHVPGDTNIYLKAYSIKDEHIRLYTGNVDSDAVKNTSTHNDRVDICAPAYGVQTLDRFGSGYTECSQDGTSFAAPLVAGTMGLMMSVNPLLSPYQREVIIKNTAKFLDNIGDNHRFAGQLGAGALQANAAVAAANPQIFDVNDPTLQTLHIAGIDFDHLCFSPPTYLPSFSVKVVNGDGRYRYDWIPFPGNRVYLDDPSSSTPKVHSAAEMLMHYMLRVTDSSPIPKVALKEFKVYLRESGSDLTMRDSEFDMLNEPNDQATVNPNNWHIWESPDLWNRDTMDGGRVHEDAQYFQNPADSNHLYVRIRNVGCASSSSEDFVKLYWTLGATGERWPGMWSDTATFCALPGPLAQAGG